MNNEFNLIDVQKVTASAKVEIAKLKERLASICVRDVHGHLIGL